MKKLYYTIILLTLSSSIYTQDVSIHFIDVGQGDCVFIDAGNYEILIDAGNNSYGESVCRYINNYVEGSLEVLVATHPDADHIGGLDKVLEDFTVETIIDSGKTHTTKTYRDYMQAVYNETEATFLKDSDKIFSVGEGITFEVIELIDGSKDNNENSVVCILKTFNDSFLFTGDLESKIEHEFLWKFEPVTVLKVGHHGSNTSTSGSFLKVIQPKYAIISCGLNNRYGHPHKEVLARLVNNNTTVYRTDIHGTIKITASPDNFRIHTSK